MKVVKRPEVRGPSGNCKGCGVVTKSHILEPASYEEYEIVEEHEMDEYISEFEEENDDEEIELRYRLLERPTVMCHKCWVRFKADQIRHLNENHEEWTTNVLDNVPAVKVFLKRWKYHDFSHESDDTTLGLLKAVRKALKEAMLRVE
jgi:hypothetical protein